MNKMRDKMGNLVIKFIRKVSHRFPFLTKETRSHLYSHSQHYAFLGISIGRYFFFGIEKEEDRGYRGINSLLITTKVYLRVLYFRKSKIFFQDEINPEGGYFAF